MGILWDMVMNNEMIGAGFDYMLGSDLVRCTWCETWYTLTLHEPNERNAFVIMPNGKLMTWPFDIGAGVYSPEGEYEHLEPTPWTVDDLTVVGPTENLQGNP